MDNFYKSREWRALRYEILRKHGFRCQACGTKGADTILHVDHIRPRSKRPDLELCGANLQVLCEDCNMGKSNLYEDNHIQALNKEERKRKAQNERILNNFENIIKEQGISVEGVVRIKEEIVREQQRFVLKEKAAELVSMALSIEGGVDDHLSTIMDLHKARHDLTPRPGDDQEGA
jgi:hypothetical protein